MKFTKKALKELKNGVFSSRLQHRVINSLLSTELNSEDLYVHLRDVMTHGCEGGSVGDLVYYEQTVRFFDCYRTEILDLATEVGVVDVEHGSRFSKEEKNDLAWFSYENVCYEILDYFENN